MRLFIAIAIPEEIRSSVASLLQEFRGVAPSLKWTNPANLHITLKFLGETDPSGLQPIVDAIANVHSTESVTLTLRNLDAFPNFKRPKILWAGIRPSANLYAITREIELATGNLGFPAEDRDFTPHLTLARLKKALLPAKLSAVMFRERFAAIWDFYGPRISSHRKQA